MSIARQFGYGVSLREPRAASRKPAASSDAEIGALKRRIAELEAVVRQRDIELERLRTVLTARVTPVTSTVTAQTVTPTITPTVTRNANAERQRRYRERKAAKQ